MNSKDPAVTRRLVVDEEWLDRLIDEIKAIPRPHAFMYHKSSMDSVTREIQAIVVANLTKEELLMLRLRYPIREDLDAKKRTQLDTARKPRP